MLGEDLLNDLSQSRNFSGENPVTVDDIDNLMQQISQICAQQTRTLSMSKAVMSERIRELEDAILVGNVNLARGAVNQLMANQNFHRLPNQNTFGNNNNNNNNNNTNSRYGNTQQQQQQQRNQMLGNNNMMTPDNFHGGNNNNNNNNNNNIMSSMMTPTSYHDNNRVKGLPYDQVMNDVVTETRRAQQEQRDTGGHNAKQYMTLSQSAAPSVAHLQSRQQNNANNNNANNNNQQGGGGGGWDNAFGGGNTNNQNNNMNNNNNNNQNANRNNNNVGGGGRDPFNNDPFSNLNSPASQRDPNNNSINNNSQMNNHNHAIAAPALPRSRQQQQQNDAWGQATSQLARQDNNNNNGSGMNNSNNLQMSNEKAEFFVTVQFKRGRMLTYESGIRVSAGEFVVVGGDRGEDIGIVNACWRTVESPPPGAVAERATISDSSAGNQVIRVATITETAQLQGIQSELENRATEVAQQKAAEHGLRMKIVDAEYQFDRKKLTFYYQSNMRLDFRNLVRDLFKTFRARIWMELDPQIGRNN